MWIILVFRWLNIISVCIFYEIRQHELDSKKDMNSFNFIINTVWIRVVKILKFQAWVFIQETWIIRVLHKLVLESASSSWVRVTWARVKVDYSGSSQIRVTCHSNSWEQEKSQMQLQWQFELEYYSNLSWGVSYY